MFKAKPWETSILNDITRKTGLTFRLVGGIDTRDKAVAPLVLPVLADWVARLDDVSHRWTIYSRFHTPYARPYLEKVIYWWTSEEDRLALGTLTQVLALIVKCSDAKQVWELCQKLPPRPGHYLLVSKLGNCPEVEREVKEVLVQALKTETLEPSELSYISQIDDARMHQWFEGKVNSPNRYVRLVARRAVARSKRLPRGMEYSPQAPERTREMFSAEDDVHAVRPMLHVLVKEFGLTIPAPIASGRFLASVPLDSWVAARRLLTVEGAAVSLWFRLEDMDTVEIVLLNEQPEGG